MPGSSCGWTWTRRWWYAILRVNRPHKLLILEIESILKCDDETKFLGSARLKRGDFEKHLRLLKADRSGHDRICEFVGPYKTQSGALRALKLMEEAAERMGAAELSLYCKQMLVKRLARRIARIENR